MKKAKKITSLLLFFFLFSLAGNLMAKEWGHGFTLAVQKADNQQTVEKFISVKNPSTSLLKPEFSIGALSHNKDYVKFQLNEQLTWFETPNWGKILKGAMYGILIGGGSLAVIYYMGGDDEPGLFSHTAEEKAAWEKINGEWKIVALSANTTKTTKVEKK